MTRIRTIRADLLDLLEYTETEEPQLYQRLQEIWKWIKDKKDGLITSKNHVLNLLEEVIQDSIFWLEYKNLTTGEQHQVNQTLSSSRYYWSLVLFPLWFQEADPKSKRWKQELFRNNFKHLDNRDILETCREIAKQGGNTHTGYILDLSMATDLIAASSISQALAIQLTITSTESIASKKDKWEKTLTYWNIKRGLLVSYDPRHGVAARVTVILQECASLPDNCYHLRET